MTHEGHWDFEKNGHELTINKNDLRGKFEI